MNENDIDYGTIVTVNICNFILIFYCYIPFALFYV